MEEGRKGGRKEDRKEGRREMKGDKRLGIRYVLIHVSTAW